MATTKVKPAQVSPSTNPGSIIASDTSNNFDIVSPSTGASHLWGYEDGSTSTLPVLLGTNLSYDAGTNTLNVSGGSGDVTKVGTPVNDQIGVWTGSGTLEGDVNLTFDTTTDTVTTVNIIATGLAKAMSLNLDTQSIATAAGTTTLTIASEYQTIFTGTTTQNCDLPDATTLTVGHRFKIINNSTQAVTVRSNGGATVWVMGGGTVIDLTCTDNSTAAGVWAKDYNGVSVPSGKVPIISNSIAISGTDGRGLNIGSATAGAILIGNGVSMVLSTPTHPTTATLNKVIVGDATNWVLSTPTIPLNAVPGAGKLLVGDGTNFILSTPTYPYSASSTARKMLVSDGTNWVASTELWPVATTSGHVMVANGTDWVSTNTRSNWTTHVTSSNFTTTSTSLVNITPMVTATLSTATVYEFECNFYVSSSSAAGIAVGVDQTGTGSGQLGMWSGTATNTAATGMTIGSNALNTAGAPCVLINGDGHITFKGFIKTGSSGSPTIAMKALKTTSGTATIYAGSVFRYRVAN